MPEKLDWLKTLPPPQQAADSFGPGDPKNVALLARLTAGLGFNLTGARPWRLRVLHWWTGSLKRPASDGSGAELRPVVCLLLDGGEVARVWDWPGVNNWLDFVLSLDPVRLSQGPLAVRAELVAAPGLTFPSWSFNLEG